MQYDQFIQRVAERAGVRPEQAVALSRATLHALGDRISGGQAEDLAAMLPEQLAQPLQRPREKAAEAFGFDQFVQRVEALVPDIHREVVRRGIRAVFLTLRDAVPDKEFRDTFDQLPREFWGLVREDAAAAAQPAAAAASAGGAAQNDALVQRTAAQAGVPAEQAAALTQATLQALRDRIGGRQAHDLAQQLPDASGQWLDQPPETPAQNYGVDDFVSRIHLLVPEVSDEDLTPAIRAVIIAMREAAGDAQVEIALQPLPDEYDQVLARES